MVTINPEIIKIPAFMTKFENLDSYSMTRKTKLILKGKLTSFVLNKFNKKFICIYFNYAFKFNGKLELKNNKYFLTNSRNKIYYPNTRFTRTILNQDEFLEHLFNSYLLHNLKFNKNDLVVDCGANVGELYFSFKNINKEIRYIGIEPDPIVFECLELNTSNNSMELCLSDFSGKKKFYLDSRGANSSLEEFKNYTNAIDVKVNKLENIFKSQKIKLLKIDSEGHELEVLKGAEKILPNIEYIAVDCGAEKGINEETTFKNVNHYLSTNNFELLDINYKRLVCLYRYKNE